MIKENSPQGQENTILATKAQLEQLDGLYKELIAAEVFIDKLTAQSNEALKLFMKIASYEKDQAKIKVPFWDFKTKNSYEYKYGGLSLCDDFTKQLSDLEKVREKLNEITENLTAQGCRLPSLTTDYNRRFLSYIHQVNIPNLPDLCEKCEKYQEAVKVLAGVTKQKITIASAVIEQSRVPALAPRPAAGRKRDGWSEGRL